MEQLIQVLDKIDSWVWGPPLLILLVGTGIYLTIDWVCFKYLNSLWLFAICLKRRREGDVSSFAALCTALAATIGTEISSVLQLRLKRAAQGLSDGLQHSSGWLQNMPKVFWLLNTGLWMKRPDVRRAVYYIERGLGIKWLAKAFALFGIGVAFFGIGTFPQVNAITDAVSLHSISRSSWLLL